MTWLLVLGYTISSSLDNLGVGMSYGIRKIQIPFISNLLIASVCFMFSYSGILFGKWISAILPGILPMLLSAFMLLVVGLRIILLAVPRKEQTTDRQKPAVKGIKSILQNPESVDFDGSNDIGFGESLILGVALSANALTNGLSAGLLGFSPLIISIASAFGSFFTIWLGMWLGGKVANVRIGSFTLGQFGTLVSGVILVIIAVHNLQS